MVLCAVVFVIFLRTFVSFWTPDCRLTFERSHRVLILVDSPLLSKQLFNFFNFLYSIVSHLTCKFVNIHFIIRFHILVDSPLSRFLRILIGLIYLLVYRLGQAVLLDLLDRVARHQGHLVQVYHQYWLLA